MEVLQRYLTLIRFSSEHPYSISNFDVNTDKVAYDSFTKLRLAIFCSVPVLRIHLNSPFMVFLDLPSLYFFSLLTLTSLFTLAL
jgi:hypothetical protein